MPYMSKVIRLENVFTYFNIAHYRVYVSTYSIIILHGDLKYTEKTLKFSEPTKFYSNIL